MCIVFVMVLTGCQEEVCTEKPVIYLYPEQETKVKVQLDYDGTLVCTYPEYNNGWKEVAQPDGTFDFSKGFVVKGLETGEK